MEGLELITNEGAEVIALSDPLIGGSSNKAIVVVMYKNDGQIYTFSVNDLKVKEFKEVTND